MSKKKMMDAATILVNVIIDGMQENKAKKLSVSILKLKQLFVIISLFVMEHLAHMFQP